MALIELNHFDLLVHPGFFQIGLPIENGHPILEDLYQKWDQKAEQESLRTGSGMIYISPVSERSRLTGLPIARNPSERMDPQRIMRYRELFGRRLVLFGAVSFEKDEEVYSDLAGTFSNQSITYDPRSTTMDAFGEIFEHCVGGFGDTVRHVLGIRLTNFQLLRELSLTEESISEIKTSLYF